MVLWFLRRRKLDPHVREIGSTKPSHSRKETKSDPLFLLREKNIGLGMYRNVPPRARPPPLLASRYDRRATTQWTSQTNERTGDPHQKGSNLERNPLLTPQEPRKTKALQEEEEEEDEAGEQVAAPAGFRRERRTRGSPVACRSP